MPEKKKTSRIKSSIVARLNSRLFLRLLGIYFGMDFLLSLLCCGGLLFWAEHQTADISALVEERGVPTAEATEWMQAGDYVVTAGDGEPRGFRLPRWRALPAPVLLVSHEPAVLAAADAVIQLDGPPFFVPFS